MNVIDLSHNIYDLRPVAQRALPMILNAVQKNQDDSRPVYILMGEQHDIPATRMLQIAVMKACKDAGLNVAYGLEQPRNLIARFSGEFNEKASHPQGKDCFWSRSDLSEIFEPKDVYALFDDPDRQHMARFCHDYCISMRFNDAARCLKHEFRMNMYDEQVQRIIKGLGYQGQQQYALIRAGDVHIRNSIMMENMIAHVKALPNKPDVYIQMLGNVHVLGNEACVNKSQFNGHIYPYRESMHGLLSEAGYSVLSVALDEGDIPLAVKGDESLITIVGLDKARNQFRDDNDMANHITHISNVSEGAIPPHREFSDSEYDGVIKRVKASYCRYNR